MVAPRFSSSGEPSVLSHSEDLVRRKAELRALLLSRRRAAPDPAAAARAVAERLLRDVTLPDAAVVSGYWPLGGELDPRPCLRRLAARGHRLTCRACREGAGRWPSICGGRTTVWSPAASG